MIAFLMLNISKTVKDIKLKFCMCVCGTEVFKKRHLIFKEFDKQKFGGTYLLTMGERERND